MRSMILVLGGVIALGGCSTFRQAEPPVCDGRHRRPANPHGSVLEPIPTPVAPEPAPESETPALASPEADGGCA
jgi:type IV secretion system protein VirB7